MNDLIENKLIMQEIGRRDVDIDKDRDGRWNEELLYLFFLLVKLEAKSLSESGQSIGDFKGKVL